MRLEVNYGYMGAVENSCSAIACAVVDADSEAIRTAVTRALKRVLFCIQWLSVPVITSG